jgi:hypothetical protein
MSRFMFLGGPKDGKIMDLDDGIEEYIVPVPGEGGVITPSSYLRVDPGKRVLIWEHLRGVTR